MGHLVEYHSALIAAATIHYMTFVSQTSMHLYPEINQSMLLCVWAGIWSGIGFWSACLCFCSLRSILILLLILHARCLIVSLTSYIQRYAGYVLIQFFFSLRYFWSDLGILWSGILPLGVMLGWLICYRSSVKGAAWEERGWSYIRLNVTCPFMPNISRDNSGFYKILGTSPRCRSFRLGANGSFFLALPLCNLLGFRCLWNYEPSAIAGIYSI